MENKREYTIIESITEDNISDHTYISTYEVMGRSLKQIKGETMEKLDKLNEIKEYLQKEQEKDNNDLLEMANKVDNKNSRNNQYKQQDYLDLRREVLAKRKLIKTILAKIMG